MTLAPIEAEMQVFPENLGLWPQEAVKIHRKSKIEMVGKVYFFYHFRILFLQITGNILRHRYPKQIRLALRPAA